MIKEESTSSRHNKLISAYFELIDIHLSRLAEGQETEMMELGDIARELCVSHKHLIAIVKQATGHHPCHFYIQKILEKVNTLLNETDYPVAEIARKLSYDPSNFTKFYKKYAGMTPGQYRQKMFTPA
ncbi:MAG: AraC family transcriptional regulator [Dyadobacter sp.]|uniref:helix-turn-helix domain-containing protein n=1 Tax=Dyadobacter sp. TaxID=1914288 RepID=UPI001B1E1F2F|nr:helix-turn-helix domain-containing protein [Dyadobacter sp.]MBO9616950.1 AraC family transcriptional regulator [Dyadobacter sp.]